MAVLVHSPLTAAHSHLLLAVTQQDRPILETRLSQTRRNGNITLCFLDKLKFHSWFFEKPGQQLLCSLYPAWLMDTDRCEQQTTVSLKQDGCSALQSWSVQFLIHRQTESAERAALLPHLHLLSRRDQRSLRLNHDFLF